MKVLPNLGSMWALKHVLKPGLVVSTIAILSAIATPIQAQVSFSDRESFNNQSIQFDVDTVVEFEFVEAHGAYQSVFGIINLATGEKTPLIQESQPSDVAQNPIAPSSYKDDAGLPTDFLSTPGNAVPQPLAEFEFKANTAYAFYLESFFNGQSEQIFYSVDSRNAQGTRRVQFDRPIQNLVDGGVLLDWDDTGSLLVMIPEEDQDFDDFIVRAGGRTACAFDAKNPGTASQSTLPSGPSSLTGSTTALLAGLEGDRSRTSCQ